MRLQRYNRAKGIDWQYYLIFGRGDLQVNVWLSKVRPEREDGCNRQTREVSVGTGFWGIL